MKVIKVGSILLLVFSTLTFGGYKMYEMFSKDTEPPRIICNEGDLVGSVSITEKEMLSGVTARDEKSGDVSGTLVVEKISQFTQENTRIITYAAIDEKGNVGRLERTLTYTDYQEPTFSLSAPLRIPMGRSVNLLESIGAKSVLDGDLSDKIKYTLDSTINVGSAGVYPVEFRVSDSCGHVEYLPLDVEVYDPSEERIKVVLSEYLIYLPLNATFQASDYYVGSDIEGVLSIQSDLDTSKAGIYNVDYIVNTTNSMGKGRLVVVVTES